MEISPKYILKLLRPLPGELRELRRLQARQPLAIGDFSRGNEIGVDKLNALVKRGWARRTSRKHQRVAVTTDLGTSLLWYLDTLEKVEVLVARFPPCAACKRSDGMHTMMCPVKLGIMGDKT